MRSRRIWKCCEGGNKGTMQRENKNASGTHRQTGSNAVVTHVGALNATKGPEGVTPAPRFVRAAHEFEGQMMKELLQPMLRENALMEDSDESGSGAVLGEFAAESLGQALSQRGGFGIANRIVQELSRSGNPSVDGKVTENLHHDTAMRSSE